MKDFIFKHPIISLLLADAVLCTVRQLSHDFTYRNNINNYK